MIGYSQVFTAAGEPVRSHGNMPTGNPAGVSIEAALAEAHGKVSDGGTVTVEVAGGCTVSLFTFSPASNTWKNPGASATSYQKVFGAAGKDYFVVRPGTLVYLKSDTGSIAFYTDLLPARGANH